MLEGEAGLAELWTRVATALHLERVKALTDPQARRAALAQALAKNIWRGQPTGARGLVLARYVASARAHLAIGDIAAGRLDFGPLPDVGDLK